MTLRTLSTNLRANPNDENWRRAHEALDNLTCGFEKSFPSLTQEQKALCAALDSLNMFGRSGEASELVRAWHALHRAPQKKTLRVLEAGDPRGDFRIGDTLTIRTPRK